MLKTASYRPRLLMLAAMAMILLTGCNSLGSGKRVSQLEVENNRLLSEFRAERQRRESAERTAQQLEMRLAESEKMLARQIQGPGTSPGRLSSLSAPADYPTAPANSTGYSAAADLQWHRRD